MLFSLNFKRFLWLFLGMLTGALVTALSSQAKPIPVKKHEFRVLAVSLEDALDKASEKVKDGHLNLPKNSVLAVRLPQCHASQEREYYNCQVEYHPSRSRTL